MNITKLQDQLIKHEGIKLKIYTDSVGKISIGVGHNLTDKGLTEVQVRSILNDDLLDTINFLNTHVPWWPTLDDVRQRAIADMTFNLMGKLLEFKKMIIAIQLKDWNKAADELLNSKFAHQTGQRARDLAFMIRTGQDV